LAYADDNYQSGIGQNKDTALADLQQKLIIAEKGSGMKVNLEKNRTVHIPLL
jgi:hypothetical protein